MLKDVGELLVEPPTVVTSFNGNNLPFHHDRRSCLRPKIVLSMRRRASLSPRTRRTVPQVSMLYTVRRAAVVNASTALLLLNPCPYHFLLIYG